MPLIVFRPPPVPKVTVNVSMAGAASIPTAVAQNLAAAGFAHGGIITSPMLAVIGQAGAAEAVIPATIPAGPPALQPALAQRCVDAAEGARVGDLPVSTSSPRADLSGNIIGGDIGPSTTSVSTPRARRARTQTIVPVPPRDENLLVTSVSQQLAQTTYLSQLVGDVVSETSSIVGGPERVETVVIHPPPTGATGSVGPAGPAAEPARAARQTSRATCKAAQLFR